MNTVMIYVLNALKAFLKTDTIVKLVTRTLLKIGGFRAWLTQLIIKRVIDRIITPKIEKKVDDIQDKDIGSEIRKEMLKDIKDIDWDKIDRLERERMGKK